MILAGRPEQLRICDCPCDVRLALPANRPELIDSVRTLLMENAQQARHRPARTPAEERIHPPG